jgi:hypothetical protein
MALEYNFLLMEQFVKSLHTKSEVTNTQERVEGCCDTSTISVVIQATNDSSCDKSMTYWGCEFPRGDNPMVPRPPTLPIATA